MTVQRLAVKRLGQRGEGVADTEEGAVFLPYALPGDEIEIQRDGHAVQGFEIVAPRLDRIAPVCPYFGSCGGCAVQALPAASYAAWKEDLVRDALRHAGVTVEVTPLIAAHGAGRRRATFHSRIQPTPNVLRPPEMRTGFMRARSHEVIDIEQCPVLAPELAPALPAVRHIARSLQNIGKPLDLVVTASATGLDIDLRGLGKLEDADRRRLTDLAATLDLARLSNHGDVIVERHAPLLRIGGAMLALPPGAFLQATAAGEAAMAALVQEGVGSARKIADLFCGLGTFALRLAERATIAAFDLEGPGLAALSRAARATPALRPVSVEARDLFRRPLQGIELNGFDAIVFDPPRAGAQSQAQALAQSNVPTVVAVSCNPVTFARDAAALIGGGYQLDSVTPIDQFLYSPHVELVATFRRRRDPARAKRRLFG